MSTIYDQQRLCKIKYSFYSNVGISYISSNHKIYRWPFPIKKERFMNRLPPSNLPPANSFKEINLFTRLT